MELSQDLIYKVKANFSQMKFEEDYNVPNSGIRHSIEVNRRMAVCPLQDFDHLVFIIAEKQTYQNKRLVDKQYAVYSFDMNGVFVKELSPKELGWDFFNNLKYLENEIIG